MNDSTPHPPAPSETPTPLEEARQAVLDGSFIIHPWMISAVRQIHAESWHGLNHEQMIAKGAIKIAESFVPTERDLSQLAARCQALEGALKQSRIDGIPALVEIPESKNPSLWRYLQNAFEKNITFHALGVNRMPDGGFHFYIHPQSVSGETHDFLVWPDPFNWSDILVNRLDSPPPDVEKFKAMLEKEFPPLTAPEKGDK